MNILRRYHEAIYSIFFAFVTIYDDFDVLISIKIAFTKKLRAVKFGEIRNSSIESFSENVSIKLLIFRN